MALLLLSVSALIQIATFGVSCRYIKVTGYRRAWIAVSLALFLMICRRLITLRAATIGDHLVPPDLATESVALAISVLLFAGVVSLGDILMAGKREQIVQAQLTERESRLRAILEHMSDGVLLLDSSGAIQSMNPAAQTILGSDISLLKSRVITEVFSALEVEMNGRRGLHDSMEENCRESFELLIQHEGQSPVTIELDFNAMEEAGLRSYIGLIRDVSERRKAETELRHAYKMEAIGQLTGGVAHDFNNLLTAISGNLELVKLTADLSPSELPLVENALTAIGRGAELTHRLLAFSRKQPLRPSAIEVGQLISEMVALITRTLGENIEISAIIAASDSSALVDGNQLQNAILNLAINARDAMPKGGKLTIEVRAAAIDEVQAAATRDINPGKYILVSVSDNGSGIPANVLDRVFDPYFTTKAPSKGSGLGLSMVQGFVKQSGGHLTIYSEEGFGTSVKIYLPELSDRDRADLDARDADLVSEPELGVDELSGTETVLLVEDDKQVREMVTTALSGLGYTVVVAVDGAEAIEKISDGRQVDLLLTDIMLPKGITGRQVAETVRAKIPSVRVLYTSGYSGKAIIHHGRLDAEADLLEKPFNLLSLARRVKAALLRPRD